MAFIDYETFDTDYLVINGMIGNRANLTKAPNQLKIEADEIKVIADIIRGVKPLSYNSVTVYREAQYCTYNSIIYRSNVASNENNQPDISAQWDEQFIGTIVGELIQGENV